MVCIYCGHSTKVTNSRGTARPPGTWRRRECLECGAQFTTRESADLESSLMVQETDGTLQPFLRDQLFVSLLNACGHRPDPTSDAGALTMTVIGKLIQGRTIRSGTVGAATIAQTCLTTLQRFDSFAKANYVAYHQTALKK